MKITRVLLFLKSGGMLNSSTIGHVSLVNKSWSKDNTMKAREIISILHTAVEFRNADKEAKVQQLKIPDLRRKSITLLLKKSNALFEASFFSAGQFVKVPTNKIILPNWDTREHVLDIRKMFEKHTNCLFCESKYLSRSTHITHDSPIPIVFICSCRYRMLIGLAQLMTIFLRFGKFNGLNVMWVGPPNTTLNSLLALSIKLNINFNYCCGFNTFAPASPSCLQYIRQQCAINFHKFRCHECNIENLDDFVGDADVIITSKQRSSDMNITKDMMDRAKPHCVILHTLNRGSCDIDDLLFEQKNCLVWEMVENTKWIFAAFMVRLLADYEHITQQPTIFYNKPKNTDNKINDGKNEPTIN